jgi:flavin reductase (DIM6/NTAB) family NADH-FMN oxidoreductase RutF
VSQVSGQPPLILAAVRRNRSLLPTLEEDEAFALNLLPASGGELLSRLARPAEKRFAGLELMAGTLGLPVLRQGLGALCCRVREIWRPGDHVLFLGQVEGVLWQGGGPSLDAGVTGHAYLGLS